MVKFVNIFLKYDKIIPYYISKEKFVNQLTFIDYSLKVREYICLFINNKPKFYFRIEEFINAYKNRMNLIITEEFYISFTIKGSICLNIFGQKYYTSINKSKEFLNKHRDKIYFVKFD